MSDEFDVYNPGENVFRLKNITGTLQLSRQKTVKILSFFDQKAKNNSNKDVSFYAEIRDGNVHLNCPRLKDLTDEYTEKMLRKISGASRDLVPPIEVEEEVDKDIIKKKSKKKTPSSPEINVREYVAMTNEECLKLYQDYGKDSTEEYLDRLNEYIGSTGKKYRSHYLTMKAWFRQDNIYPQEKQEVVKHEKKPITCRVE